MWAGGALVGQRCEPGATWVACVAMVMLAASCGGESGGTEADLPGLDTGPGDAGLDVVAPDGGADTGVGPGDTVGPGPAEPVTAGRVVWRRLNRTEYRNTVRDLFGTSLDPGVDLPSDDLGYGFDNVASVLTLSPLHLELYERAARLLTEEVTRVPVSEPQRLIVEGELADSSVEWGGVAGQAYFMGSSGELTGFVVAPADGRYAFEVRAWETPAGDEPAKLGLWVSGAMVGVVELTPSPRVHALELELEAGRHAVAVEFLNDYFDASTDPPADRNAVVDWFGLVGPEELEDYASSAWARMIQCRPAAFERSCAQSTVAEFARRAWRRPLEEAARERLMEVYDAAIYEGTPGPEALALVMQAVLLSPRFIFKVEQDRPVEGETRLDGYELAVRLSYFLWSTMPDEVLFEAARVGRLDTTEGIVAEVRRMIADPRSQALVDNFAGQWLYIRDIDNVFPDPWVFSEFDEALRSAMIEEMRRFFLSFVREDRSMLEMLTASETWVNRRLAEHYGVEDVANAPSDDGTWARVSTEGVGRRGLLSKAGLLTALSTPFRTSVVRRGKWTLGQLLCAEPSPPPPGVEGLLEANNGPIDQSKSLRERMELHKSEERCRTCHVAMDGIGYALEHFDGIGAWRDDDRGHPIDATGVLRGQAYDGALQLAEVIAADARLPACFVDKVAIYALGRGLYGEDQPLLDRLVDDFAERGHRFPALIELVATSRAFTHRSVEGPR